MQDFGMFLIGIGSVLFLISAILGAAGIITLISMIGEDRGNKRIWKGWL